MLLFSAFLNHRETDQSVSHLHNPFYLTYLLNPLRTGGVHKAEVNVLHTDLSCAIFSMEPHVHSFCFSRLMERYQVSFGLPQDLFPSGVHLRAIVGGEDEGMRRICPDHRNLCCCISTDTGFRQVLSRSSSLLMVLG